MTSETASANSFRSDGVGAAVNDIAAESPTYRVGQRVKGVNTTLWMTQKEWLLGVDNAMGGEPIHGCPHCGLMDELQHGVRVKHVDGHPATVVNCGACDTRYVEVGNLPSMADVEGKLARLVRRKAESRLKAPAGKPSKAAIEWRRDVLQYGQRLASIMHAEVGLVARDGEATVCVACRGTVSPKSKDWTYELDPLGYRFTGKCPSCASGPAYTQVAQQMWSFFPTAGFALLRSPCHTRPAQCRHTLTRIGRNGLGTLNLDANRVTVLPR